MENRTLPARCLATVILLCCLQPLAALDRHIVMGREDRWEALSLLDNLTLAAGRWGTLDLALRDNRHAVTEQTDLLLHFDASPARDETGRYTVNGGDALLSERFFVLGGGSAAFTGARAPVRLLPGPESLFAPATWIGDFSIEFWLYPALLNDGEEVLSWTGARWRGKEATAQAVRCTVRGRRLAWRFDNFFTGPGAEPTRVSLQGLTPLVPRDWHHHLLRYDSGTGLLEYLVDGVPEGVTYTTDSGRERGTLWLPFAGEAHRGSLEVGPALTGFVDELRILRGFVEEPSIARYAGTAGTAVSEPFDLGYTGTRLKRIEATYRTPGDSAVLFYYRLYDRIDEASANERSAAWRQYLPGRPLEEARGRYLQLMVELHPDGPREQSPEVSELRAVYEQDLPPSPPASLQALAANGAVQLYWKAVNESDVRGYLVYYGDSPGSYRGSDSDLGQSPIDVGNVSELLLTGLRNGKLYHFSVVAYDATDPPHRSLFAREVSARPSGFLEPGLAASTGPGTPRAAP